MSYYYPERTYHQLNAVAYPDHSRPLTGMDGIIRAFWRKGEQMWDEDMNNSLEWFRWWEMSYAHHRWQSPKYPWYSPALTIYIVETDHNADPDPENDHAVFWQFLTGTMPAFPLKPWPGVTTTILADRQWIGYRQNPGGSGGGWQGLSMFQEYVDEIEIAFFISETRADRIIAQHIVKEPFRLHADCYSGRVRGWTKYGQISILKNGVAVGFAAQYEESSAVRAFSGLPVEFEEGDVLSLKAPAVSPFVGNIYKAVSVSLVGELI